MPTTFLLLPPLELDGGKLDAVLVPSPCLPTDILLQIFVRTDPATLVRCAATSKDHLRRVADPAFLRRYGHRLDSRFVPSLLLGLYCDDYDSDDEDDDQLFRIMVPPGQPPAATTPCRSLGEDAVSALMDWNYAPATACAGLLFAKDLYTSPDLVKGRVIHTSRPQRYYTSIPPADISSVSLVLLPEYYYDDDENGLISFRLVAVNLSTVTSLRQSRLCAQIFRSRSGKWDWVPPMDVSLPGGSPHTWHDTQATVLGSGARVAAYWLCKSGVSYHVVSFHIDDAQADVIELPPGCQDRGRNSEELLLAPSEDRKRLTLLVADGLKINVWIWTRAANSTETGRWALHMVIDVLGAARELSQRWPLPRQVDPEARVKFERWFGERSGTAVLKVDRCGHFALNPATKKLQLLKEFSETVDMWVLCGHEISPIPLLRKLQLLNIAY
ncbi:unnamed protein product [Urochloa decumbens]|uniref:F-box domain-containing protein n=1 Tax=Urochloa decumbens TaxID=240449 RepID=A0ABC8WUQ4_9POAL